MIDPKIKEDEYDWNEDHHEAYQYDEYQDCEY